MKRLDAFNSQSERTKLMVMSALMIAFTAVCSWISIPLPGSVPINLATAAVIMTGLILGRKWGLISIGTFLLLGAVGVPVFHSFTGGMGIIAGPTGGYLIGYLVLALGAGWAKDSGSLTKPILCMLYILVGEALLYVIGTIWYMELTGTPLAAALAACVVPFIPGDIVKIIVAYRASRQISKALN